MEKLNDRLKYRIFNKKDNRMYYQGINDYYKINHYKCNIIFSDKMYVEICTCSKRTPIQDDRVYDEIETLSEDDFILMQCTGEKDMNRRSIYEGDVVKIGSEEGYSKGLVIIKYDKDLLNWNYECMNGKPYLQGLILPKTYEMTIVGNLYE